MQQGRGVRGSRRILRFLAATAVMVGSVMVPATVAQGDPARPTNYESKVLSSRPELPAGVDLAIVGGDAFLRLSVERGHEVIVPDYSQGPGTTPPPYLSFASDGTVSVNESSAAAVINDSRYGRAGATVDLDQPPRWRTVATDGTYAWHDHRVHWMTPNTPPTMAGTQRIDMGGPDGTWEVDLIVDGVPTLVTGELILLPAPSPAPWLAIAAIVAVAVGAMGVVRVRSTGQLPLGALAVGLTATGLVAAGVGWAEWHDVPAGAGGSPFLAIVPAVGAAAGAVALAVSAARVRLAALLAAVACLGAWAWLRRLVVARAVLPTTLPFALDRLVTVIALGLAVAVGALVLWRPPVRSRPT